MVRTEDAVVVMDEELRLGVERGISDLPVLTQARVGCSVTLM